LAPPERIAATVADLLAPGDLHGMRVLVTAGPTREPLDPVRFISNRSSGKMGYALASAAARRGGQVTLVTGPTALPEPDGCEVVRVQTAAQMYEEVLCRFPKCQVLIAAAAVADYAPASPADSKIKKGARPLSLKLRPTQDILAECGRGKKPSQFLVGFAAETDHLLDHARKKLAAKDLDLIVANDVSRSGIGFDSDRTAGCLIFSDGREVELPEMTKQAFAERILDAVVETRPAKRAHRRKH
jgi:phosphopantothenoylcysteine decarboxylase/phosphopantothenate--cysteine ligase